MRVPSLGEPLQACDLRQALEFYLTSSGMLNYADIEVLSFGSDGDVEELARRVLEA